MTTRSYKIICAIGVMLLALFWTQGIPLWDDDFTTWFRQVHVKSLTKILAEILLPLSNQPEHWGFVDRPLQSLLYKIMYAAVGYTAWPYFLFRSLVFGFLGLGIMGWILQFAKNRPEANSAENDTVEGKSLIKDFRFVPYLAASFGVVFFITAPGPNAALLLHSDFAPISECLWVWLTLGIFRQSEKKDQRLLTWILLIMGVYLGYKSKADLKLIPLLFLGYWICGRFFTNHTENSALSPKRIAAIGGAMILLAVPWSGQLFSELPPWMPGSKGSSVGYMWQPASFMRAFDFIRDKNGQNFWGNWNGPVLALIPLVSPFLLLFFLWNSLYGGFRFSRIRKWLRLEEASDRALLWVTLWTILIFAAVSPLPELNPAFRVRYGILTAAPISILLAGLLLRTLQGSYWQRLTSRHAKILFGILAGLFGLQSALNLNRVIQYRKDLGRVMVSVNRAYEFIEANHKDYFLFTHLPYLIYDYKPHLGSAFEKRSTLANIDDLIQLEIAGKAKKNETLVLSWNVEASDTLLFLGAFDGCNGSLFDKIFGCKNPATTYLYKWKGAETPHLYQLHDQWMAKSGVDGTIENLTIYLKKYPNSQAGAFMLAVAYGVKGNYEKACEINAQLVQGAPWEPRYLHNYGDCLLKTFRLAEAKPIYQKLKTLAPDQKLYDMALQYIKAPPVKNPENASVKGTTEGGGDSK